LAPAADGQVSRTPNKGDPENCAPSAAVSTQVVFNHVNDEGVAMKTLTINLTDEQASTLRELAESPDAVAGGLASAIGGFAAAYAAGKAIDGLIEAIKSPRDDYGSVDVIGA
jgi:hypothetical protein